MLALLSNTFCWGRLSWTPRFVWTEDALRLALLTAPSQKHEPANRVIVVEWLLGATGVSSGGDTASGKCTYPSLNRRRRAFYCIQNTYMEVRAFFVFDIVANSSPRLSPVLLFCAADRQGNSISHVQIEGF